MAAAGFTPVSLYYSTTASAQPTAPNLVLGELAINITDGKLYYKTVGGVITLLASANTAAGNASNILGGTTGAIAYQSAVNTTTFLSVGSASYILTSNGTLPTYTNPASITVGNATTAGSATTAGTATNIAGGTTSSLVYQSAVGTTAFLSLGTNGYILTSNGTTPAYTNPTSITVGNATAAVTSTNIANGLVNQLLYQTGPNATGFAPAPTNIGYVLGWNGSSFTWVAAPAATTAANIVGGSAGTIVYQSAISTTAFVAPGTAGQVFLSNGTSAPQWTNQSSLSVGSATNATNSTNIIGGVAGAVPYQSGVGATSFSAAGTASQVLLSGGTGSPTWTNQSSLSAGSAALATNVAGGAASQILYQSGADTTAFIANGTAGQVLISNGTSAPSWQNAPATGLTKAQVIAYTMTLGF
jgi:hypothetical protein